MKCDISSDNIFPWSTGAQPQLYDLLLQSLHELVVGLRFEQLVPKTLATNAPHTDEYADSCFAMLRLKAEISWVADAATPCDTRIPAHRDIFSMSASICCSTKLCFILCFSVSASRTISVYCSDQGRHPFRFFVLDIVDHVADFAPKGGFARLHFFRRFAFDLSACPLRNLMCAFSCDDSLRTLCCSKTSHPRITFILTDSGCDHLILLCLGAARLGDLRTHRLDCAFGSYKLQPLPFALKGLFDGTTFLMSRGFGKQNA